MRAATRYDLRRLGRLVLPCTAAMRAAVSPMFQTLVSYFKRSRYNLAGRPHGLYALNLYRFNLQFRRFNPLFDRLFFSTGLRG